MLINELNKLNGEENTSTALPKLPKRNYIKSVRYVPTVYENFKLYQNEIYLNGREEFYKCIFQLASQTWKENYSLVS